MTILCFPVSVPSVSPPDPLVAEQELSPSVTPSLVPGGTAGARGHGSPAQACQLCAHGRECCSRASQCFPKLRCARWVLAVKVQSLSSAQPGQELGLSLLQSPTPARHLTWPLLLGVSTQCGRCKRQLRRGTGLILSPPAVPSIPAADGSEPAEHPTRNFSWISARMKQ